MDHSSRTYKSLKNSVVASAFFAVTFVLSFVSRRILLRGLGADILGLNTLAGSLLSFLNLAELGIGTAVAVTLYKPLLEKDQEKVSQIVSIQGWFYRRVAWAIVGGSAVMMCFFPLIFKSSGLPILYAFASYSVLLFSSLLGYFFNYRQIVLSASQQQYRIQYSYSSVNILKVVAQMLAVSLLAHKYLWWLLLEALFTVIGTVTLNIQVRKAFPDLVTDVRGGGSLRRFYPDVMAKVKQVFVHRIGTFTLTQTSPVIIYAYASLAAVTSYGNYMVIFNGIMSALNAVFNGVYASVGNLVAEGDRSRIYSVFRELFSFRFLIVGTLSFCMYRMASSFIGLWVGQEFILDRVTVLLITLLFFIRTSREVVDSFNSAYGLFHDVWAPLAEAAINISCSILFGLRWGIAGILAGVLLSQVIIILLWKPYLLYSEGFKDSFVKYVALYVKHAALLLLAIGCVAAVMRSVTIRPDRGIPEFFLYGILMEALLVLVAGVLFYLTEKGMRDFVSRMCSIVTKARRG